MQSKNSLKGFLADIQASSVVLRDKQQLESLIYGLGRAFLPS